MSKLKIFWKNFIEKLLSMQKIWRVLWVLILCFIWGNSMIPVSKSEDMSILVMDKANEMVGGSGQEGASDGGEGSSGGFQFSLPSIRKLAHVLEFMVFSALTYAVVLPQNKQELCNIFFIGFLVAFLDETIQLFPEGRGSYVIDVWIDLIGVALGILLMIGIRRSYEKLGGKGFGKVLVGT